jgi:small subunit ribosomal protein S6
MRSYELVVVVRSSLADADRKKLIDNVKKLLEGVKFSKEEEWGQKPLAYPIKKELTGHYYFFKFEGEEVAPAGFEQKLLLNDNILRHLLLRKK